ncbi:Uncharacterised protein [Segatella copri]|nr:Uncharacterised protein [Segatella copri]
MTLGTILHLDIDSRIIRIGKIIQDTNRLMLSHNFDSTNLILRQCICCRSIFSSQHVKPFDIELADRFSLVRNLTGTLVHIKARHFGDNITDRAIITVCKGTYHITDGIATFMHLIRFHRNLLKFDSSTTHFYG